MVRLHDQKLTATVNRLLPWRQALLGLAAALLILLVPIIAYRQALADWVWPEGRLQTLLARADQALALGHLSVPDGTGARELFQAALALDEDRTQARSGLARTGEAALAQAQQHLAHGRYAASLQALQLADDLQMPRARIQALATQISRQRLTETNLTTWLVQAQAARQAGQLDQTPDSALPLYARVLAVAPLAQAIEGRDGALVDLLARARHEIAHGNLELAKEQLQSAQRYDPAQADLPQTQELFYQAIDRQLQNAGAELHHLRFSRAIKLFQRVQQMLPDDPRPQRGLESVAQALAQDAVMQANRFHFNAAQSEMTQLGQLPTGTDLVMVANQAIERARHRDQQMRAASPIPARIREMRVHHLLDWAVRAMRQGRWFAPPGKNAFDAVRQAQELAPDDRRVQQVMRQVSHRSEEFFEQSLRDNRVEAAQKFIDIWSILSPQVDRLLSARRRLAQRLVAMASEHLGAGDMNFAERAALSADRLDPQAPGLRELHQRLGSLKASQG